MTIFARRWKAAALGPSLPAMRRLLLVALLVLGACAEPKNADVSEVGPTTTEDSSTTEKERTTTTAKETTTTEAPTTTAAPVPVEVGRWAGTADTDTPNFTVVESWELHWRVSGGAGAAVSWLEPGAGFPTDYLQLAEGEHVSLVREGGTFYMEISTFGASYEVWVVDVPN